jgi:hypothetical protein
LDIPCWLLAIALFALFSISNSQQGISNGKAFPSSGGCTTANHGRSGLAVLQAVFHAPDREWLPRRCAQKNVS